MGTPGLHRSPAMPHQQLRIRTSLQGPKLWHHPKLLSSPHPQPLHPADSANSTEPRGRRKQTGASSGSGRDTGRWQVFILLGTPPGWVSVGHSGVWNCMGVKLAPGCNYGRCVLTSELSLGGPPGAFRSQPTTLRKLHEAACRLLAPGSPRPCVPELGCTVVVHVYLPAFVYFISEEIMGFCIPLGHTTGIFTIVLTKEKTKGKIDISFWPSLPLSNYCNIHNTEGVL